MSFLSTCKIIWYRSIPIKKAVHHFVILLTDVDRRKNHRTVTDLNRVNFVDSFYFFIFQPIAF